jgi:circadian clock protein KaiC
MAMSFMMEGAKRGERGLYIAFEESKTQLLRNAESFSWPMEKYIKDGTIEIIAKPPEERPPEEYFKYVKDIVKERKIKRFVLDSLSSLERVYEADKFLELVVGLNTYLKSEEITSYFTNTTSALIGGGQISETHLSTLTDNIIILKYVEVEGEMKRAVSILKTRGSQHDKRLHEIIIDENGSRVGEPFIGYSGVMGGVAERVAGPPVDVSEQMKDIDVLRKKFLDKEITQDSYFKGMAEIKKQIYNIQQRGF